MQVQAAYDAMTESLRHNMDANLHLDYSYVMLHGTIYTWSNRVFIGCFIDGISSLSSKRCSMR